MCLKEIELHAHNMITILDSIVNIIVGGAYMTVSWTRESPHELRNYEESGYGLDLDLVPFFVLITWFISQEKWSEKVTI